MKIMAIDYGEARTGFAVCDKDEIIASPLCVVHEKDLGRLIVKAVSIAAENGAEEIIVGDPVNMDGSRGEKSAKCALFAEKLRKSANIPVFMRDERLTTVIAANIMNENNRRGKRRRETIDAAAAALILEDYIACRKNLKGGS
ncbi:MAG: Holliday junction resolvase RuvX [Oscillospiraceae bacterium]|jgi:putative Holliday junction resolvase|nr:Holliday junction resolvase RuvX [Oscillospiraceae bacterium]